MTLKLILELLHPWARLCLEGTVKQKKKKNSIFQFWIQCWRRHIDLTNGYCGIRIKVTCISPSFWVHFSSIAASTVTKTFWIYGLHSIPYCLKWLFFISKLCLSNVGQLPQHKLLVLRVNGKNPNVIFYTTKKGISDSSLAKRVLM